MEITFFVVDSWLKLPREGRLQAYLIHDDWDDWFSFQTKTACTSSMIEATGDPSARSRWARLACRKHQQPRTQRRQLLDIESRSCRRYSTA